MWPERPSSLSSPWIVRPNFGAPSKGRRTSTSTAKAWRPGRSFPSIQTRPFGGSFEMNGCTRNFLQSTFPGSVRRRHFWSTAQPPTVGFRRPFATSFAFSKSSRKTAWPFASGTGSGTSLAGGATAFSPAIGVRSAWTTRAEKAHAPVTLHTFNSSRFRPARRGAGVVWWSNTQPWTVSHCSAISPFTQSAHESSNPANTAASGTSAGTSTYARQ